ncbi:hypothetical protein PInf_017203 [Phytophthora infestans]|nr:hypothetical protein PInf_017157 [Phytophthora infestans]KAI9991827.1 hypothetical protein PInf_017203 [Phytophthora infestans]
MAITNAFIVYRVAKRQSAGQAADHAELLEVLHDQLLQVTAADLVNEYYPNNKYTCFQIWHDLWKNGEERPPPLVGRGCQMRPLGKPRSHSLERDEEEEKNEQEEEKEEVEGEMEEESDKGPGVVQGRQTAVI